MTPDTLTLIRRFLAERLDVPAERVTPEAVLADLGVDSLMFAEMLFEFEDRTGSEIDIQSADSMPCTVGELVTLVDQHRARTASQRIPPSPSAAA